MFGRLLLFFSSSIKRTSMLDKIVRKHFPKLAQFVSSTIRTLKPLEPFRKTKKVSWVFGKEFFKIQKTLMRKPKLAHINCWLASILLSLIFYSKFFLSFFFLLNIYLIFCKQNLEILCLHHSLLKALFEKN